MKISFFPKLTRVKTFPFTRLIRKKLEITNLEFIVKQCPYFHTVLPRTMNLYCVRVNLNLFIVHIEELNFSQTDAAAVTPVRQDF